VDQPIVLQHPVLRLADHINLPELAMIDRPPSMLTQQALAAARPLAGQAIPVQAQRNIGIADITARPLPPAEGPDALVIDLGQGTAREDVDEAFDGA
jgi:hypothetical protein